MENQEIKVGTIMVASWGYSMTLVNFFKVTKRTAKTLTLVEIGAVEKADGFLSGSATPIENVVIGEPFSRRIGKYGVRGSNSSQRCQVWDGAPKYFNHCD